MGSGRKTEKAFIMKHCTNFVETIILKGSHDCPINLNGFDKEKTELSCGRDSIGIDFVVLCLQFHLIG